MTSYGPGQPRPIYTVVQLTEYLGRSEDFIRAEIRDGNLRARKQRSLTVITADDLGAYLEGLAVATVFASAAEAKTSPAPTPALKRGRRRIVRLLDPYAAAAFDDESEAAR